MKILSIQAAYFPMIGGAELFHQKTAEWLVSMGHQVDVVTCAWDKPDVVWKNWNKEKETVKGVRIFRTKPWFYIHYLKSLGAIMPLYLKSLQLIKLGNYDLIHAHIFPGLLVGAMLKAKTDLPLVTTLQGGDLADYTETGSFFALLLKPIISRALKKSDLVHTVSTHMKDSVKKLQIKNIKVIPNGVDGHLFKPRLKSYLRNKYKINRHKFVIISHSRLTLKNGLDILIKAIKKIKNKKNILVFLVGGGEQEKELKSMVKKLKLFNTIKFLGYKDRKTVAEFLALADIFVRPSRQEGFGISFLEAMASGLPVIGAKVGGIPQVVGHKKEGILVSPENVESLLAALEKLIADNDLREKMGMQGRKKAINYFCWPTIAGKLEKLYQGLLAK